MYQILIVMRSLSGGLTSLIACFEKEGEADIAFAILKDAGVYNIHYEITKLY